MALSMTIWLAVSASDVEVAARPPFSVVESIAKNLATNDSVELNNARGMNWRSFLKQTSFDNHIVMELITELSCDPCCRQRTQLGRSMAHVMPGGLRIH